MVVQGWIQVGRGGGLGGGREVWRGGSCIFIRRDALGNRSISTSTIIGRDRKDEKRDGY